MRRRERAVSRWRLPSVTFSFRMSQELQRELSDVAQRMGKGKNAIIIEALVHAMKRESLAEAARRSIRASFQERAGRRLVRTGGPVGMEIKRSDVVICAAPGDFVKPRPAAVVQPPEPEPACLECHALMMRATTC